MKNEIKLWLLDNFFTIVTILLLIALLLLTGCSSPHSTPAVKIITQRVDVPVSVPCIKKQDIPKKGDYVTIMIGKNDEPVVKIRKLDKLSEQYYIYSKLLEDIVSVCGE